MITGYLKTTILLAALTAFVMGVGYLIGGESGMQTALIFAVVLNGAMYWFSDKIVLRMAQAIPLKQSDHPELYTATKALSKKMGIPMPKLYKSSDLSPNAFATGRSPSKGIVCVTEGLLQHLESNEVEAVIAHELAHIKNFDTLISTIASVLSGAIASMADMAFWSGIFGSSNQNNEENQSPFGALSGVVMLIIAPLIASMIQFAISRSREFEADRTAALATRKPLNLASALLKIEQVAKGYDQNFSPAVSALSIHSSLRADGIMSLFSTHPPTAKRVEKLKNLRISP